MAGDLVHSDTTKVLTERAALQRLLPELIISAQAGRITPQRLIRLLAPPDWIRGMMQAAPNSAC